MIMQALNCLLALGAIPVERGQPLDLGFAQSGEHGSGGRLRPETVRRHAILIADDDEVLAGLIASALALENYPSRQVTTQEAVLDSLDEQEWALVLLDTLEERPGDEARRFIVEVCRRAGTTPVIVMTAWQEMATPAEALPGAGVLKKPFDLDELMQRVRDLTA